jgi:hypothetical protein
MGEGRSHLSEGHVVADHISVFRYPGNQRARIPCLRESRNPDHRKPKMARSVNEVKESQDLIVIVDHPEKITTIDLG